jgi:hypothetical protein
MLQKSRCAINAEQAMVQLRLDTHSLSQLGRVPGTSVLE